MPKRLSSRVQVPDSYLHSIPTEPRRSLYRWPSSSSASPRFASLLTASIVFFSSFLLGCASFLILTYLLTYLIVNQTGLKRGPRRTRRGSFRRVQFKVLVHLCIHTINRTANLRKISRGNRSRNPRHLAKDNTPSTFPFDAQCILLFIPPPFFYVLAVSLA